MAEKCIWNKMKKCDKDIDLFFKLVWGIIEFFIQIVVIVISFLFIKKQKNIKNKGMGKKELEKEDNYIHSMVLKYFDILNTRFDQHTYQDDYGFYHYDDVYKESDYFVKNILYPNKILNKSTVYQLSDRVRNFYLDECRRRRKEQREIEKSKLSTILSPIDFENACKGILEDAGWKSRITKKSGDQGVDVIAKKDGITLVVQCKYYSKPVGNKAVQEVSAGKIYYKADYAAVVSNNTYTKSARQLALNCKVLLLNIYDLSKIEKYLK